MSVWMVLAEQGSAAFLNVLMGCTRDVGALRACTIPTIVAAVPTIQASVRLP